MSEAEAESRRLFALAQERQAAHDIAGALELTRRAVEADAGNTAAAEQLATMLVTRRRRYAEGLALIERAVALRPDDAGLWYALGWLCEFAAHELRRRPSADGLEPRALYERAAAAFRTCIAMRPEGKLLDDAVDLLDHVENELG